LFGFMFRLSVRRGSTATLRLSLLRQIQPKSFRSVPSRGLL